MNRVMLFGQRFHKDDLMLPTEEYYRRRQKSGGTGRWLLFIVVVLAVVIAAIGAEVSAQALVSENDTATAEPVTLDDVQAGDLLFTGAEPGRYVPAVHLHSRVKMVVRGLVAEVQLQQAFQNTSDSWQEAVYALPLPEQAAVAGLEIQLGERRIVGKVRERKQAAKIYKAARAAGKRAALLEQQRPNLFTNKVANIAPGETVQVNIRYLQPVTYDSGVFSLRLPTTLTPRYIPGEPIPSQALGGTELELATQSSGWALPTDQVPDAEAVTPLMQPAAELEAVGSHNIAIEVELESGLPLVKIGSPYHDIAIDEKAGERYSIRLRKGRAKMDRDFLLNWQPEPSAMPRAALFSEHVSERVAGVQADGRESADKKSGTYLQLMLLPPDEGTRAQRLPREVVYVIDTSGSMGGNSIRQAKESLTLALSRLDGNDRFNVIEFNNSPRAFFPRPLAASAENIQRARREVERLNADGGTEMAAALRLALGQQLPDNNNLVHQVVFITDGAVGNEQALFELIHQHLGDARLFTVGIGSAPNSHFMRKAAQFGRGSFVTIGDLSEVRRRMQTLFAKLENPMATDLQLSWPEGVVADAYPKRIPDLYRGEPLQLVARVEGESLQGDIQLHGRMAGKQFVRNLALTLEQAPSSKGIGSLWARNKMESLRDRQTQLGEESDAGQAMRAQILQLALDHQLASPYTSFVAVEEELVRKPEEKLSQSALSNMVPRGQVLQRQAYPSTATGVYAQLFAALSLLSLAALLRRGRSMRANMMGAIRRLLRKVVPDLRRCNSGLEVQLGSTPQ
ncbi:marine proteobacterial sortase target protein [Microbulbifer variabilis]|uniref:Marine proteobacterial sortase target protein n=1 Tax=Microbulbifer variabilis TaxID=266805 RepID=A0ABY4VIJ5_9GAMM|nr:marine proteobacterial sortase target protein [Microbulbifer variabilis]USD22277.1 marine proteobacterial sortase target protein [Microbulbifer variabilis]